MIVVREKNENEKNEYSPINSVNLILSEPNSENLMKSLESIRGEELYYVKNGSPNFHIVYRSKVQEQGFNFPYQIGTHGNSPQQADEFSVEVFPGDLVILGTDGMFDNLHTPSILKVIESLYTEKKLNPQSISKELAEEAYKLSLEENYLSPFMFSALLNAGMFYKGGKSDDITVSVGIVQK